tara:strand:- start:808 stop:1002 length:195 start_codon:yes stop_codon:yes gene_type:complete
MQKHIHAFTDFEGVMVMELDGKLLLCGTGDGFKHNFTAGLNIWKASYIARSIFVTPVIISAHSF